MKFQILSNNWKYLYDLTLAESIHMETVLTKIPNDKWILPLNFHSRTSRELLPDRSLMQGQIMKLENYAKENQMKIRMEKSKEMNFHTEKKIDFFPQVIIYNTTLDVVNKFKILGVVVTNDLKWNGNTKFITIRAYWED